MIIVATPCLCVDVFAGTGEIRPGGEELNFAAHACNFDEIDVVLIGAIGRDKYGEAIIQSIKNKRIDTRLTRVEEDYTTANNMTYLTDEGDRYYKEDSWNGKILEEFTLTEKDIDIISKADVVFTHYYASCFTELVNLKKKHGFKLAVDFDVNRDFVKLEEYCPYIDFFMISGKEELSHIIKNFSEKYDGLFNMTLAKNGSVTYQHGIEYRVNAEPVENIVDSTGAGDSYHAGFVCSYLQDGDITKAMTKGSKIAADTLTHYGGFR